MRGNVIRIFKNKLFVKTAAFMLITALAVTGLQYNNFAVAASEEVSAEESGENPEPDYDVDTVTDKDEIETESGEGTDETGAENKADSTGADVESMEDADETDDENKADTEAELPLKDSKLKLSSSSEIIFANFDSEGKALGSLGYKMTDGKKVYYKKKNSYSLSVKGMGKGDTVKYRFQDEKMGEYASLSKKGKLTAIKANFDAPVIVEAVVSDSEGNVKETLIFEATIKKNTTEPPTIKEAAADNKLTVNLSGKKTTNTNSAVTLHAIQEEGTTDFLRYEFYGTEEEIAAYEKIAALDKQTGELWTKAPGTVKVRAYCYQSSSYPGVTAASEVLTVNAQAKLISVKQASINSVYVTFDSPASLVMKETKVSHTIYQDVRTELTFLKSAADEKDSQAAVVSVFEEMVGGEEYAVSYGEDIFTFKGADTSDSSIDHIEIADCIVIAGRPKELSVKFYNSEGIDITPLDLGDRTVRWEMTGGNYGSGSATIGGSELTINDAGEKADVKVSYSFYDASGDTKTFIAEKSFTAISVLDAITSYKFGIVTSSTKAVSAALKSVLMDRTYYIVGRITLADGTIIKSSDIMYSDNFSYEVISDEKALLSNGNRLIAYAEGDVQVLCYYLGKPLQCAEVKSRKAQYMAAIIPSSEYPYLSVSAGIADNITIDIVRSDQYGTAMEKKLYAEFVSSSNSEITGADLESVAWYEDYLTIESEDILGKDTLAAGSMASVKIRLYNEDNTCEAFYTFFVGKPIYEEGTTSTEKKLLLINYNEKEVATVSVSVENKETIVDPATLRNRDVSVELYDYVGKYKVKQISCSSGAAIGDNSQNEALGTNFYSSKEAAFTALSGSDVPTGSTAYFYDVVKSTDGKAPVSGSAIDFTFHPIYNDGNGVLRLTDAGSYVFRAYKAVKRSNDAVATSENTALTCFIVKRLTVKDSQAAIDVEQTALKTKTYGLSILDGIKECFDITEKGENIESYITDCDVIAAYNPNTWSTSIYVKSITYTVPYNTSAVNYKDNDGNNLPYRYIVEVNKKFRLY